MEKKLMKIATIILLVFSMTLADFSTIVRAVGPKTQETQEIETFTSKDELKNKEESIKLPKLEDIDSLIDSAEEVKQEEDVEKMPPLKFPEIPDINTRSIKEGNNYPIVLVHGFMGFGRDELLGYKYWGGAVDLQEKLNVSGHKTYTAAVGPVSSNWDRACELYAYIVGGTVDYGEAHSKKFKHNRYGRTYQGIYKNISNENKIHLIGHSMGGQTIRTLTQLLSEGSEEEINCGQENISPLFEGGKHWIHSVTTISTPNDGTTLSDLIPAKDLLSYAFGALGTVTDKNNLFSSLYDLKLDQWGLKKKQGESQRDYINRVLESSIWNNTKDIATYDLSTKGAKELNTWVKAQPDVYYFSWTTQATRESILTGHSVAQIGPMNPIFYIPGNLIGKYSRNEKDLPIIDSKWFPNDGIVNCISQSGPKLGSDDVIEQYNGGAKIGQWNAMPRIINTDHMDIVGTFGNVKDWYIEYANLLRQLSK
ncbi:lipase [Clostridium sporogenes]|uniref:triacylglycerol lipase n=1 Tax=Clostridium sporogenes TaxID=1509 RepID=A0AAE4JSX0_CLOSG|nr:lipase [Clostridium sporogenes]MDS1003850.1 lipase [Clostridium sporogenes]